jgi:hypothetical protein
MPYKKITGIYKIVNLINNKIYIGSAVSITQRFYNHKKLLESNKHFNTHLQSSWNKHKCDSFVFLIIELCAEELLQEKEEFYISKFKSNNKEFGYNKRIDCKTNLGLKSSDETKLKLRLSHLGQKRSQEAHNKIVASQYKSVCQIDKNGKLMNVFKSMLEAEEKTGIHRQAISGCCRKITISAKNFFWCYENDLKDFKIKNDERTIGTVLQLTKDGKTVKEWVNATTASKQLKLSQGNICAVIRGERETCGGYKWKLK